MSFAEQTPPILQEVMNDGSSIDNLFGPLEKPAADSPWLPALFDFARSAVCSGLGDDRRSNLLKQYETKDTLFFLGPPKLNKLLGPILKASTSVIKRDEHQVQLQAQVAASLNAFSSAISVLLAPEVKKLLPVVALPTLRQLADGFHLLTDHQYRLSLARRAFIKFSFSLVGKNATDNAPVDEWLSAVPSLTTSRMPKLARKRRETF